MSSDKALTTQSKSELSAARYEPKSLEQLDWLAKQVVSSGLAPSGVKRPEDAMCILMTGAELGLTAMQSLRSIHVIKGRPTLSADLQVALVRNSDQCEYFQLVEATDEHCEYETKRAGAPKPVSWTYTMADAQRANLTDKDVWQQYPKHMLRARCASSLARAEYPEVVMGLYTPEEAASIDGGELGDDVIEAEFQATDGIQEEADGPMTGLQGKAQAYTDRIRERLSEVDAGDDTYMEALAAWACEKYSVEHWRWLSLDQLEDVGKAVASRSAKGGRLSPRRLYIDRLVADADVTVDWSVTGNENSDEWDRLNKRWRALTNEAASGDDTLERYHEAIKASHDVSSFNDLTAAQLMDDIHQLEDRQPTHPEGGMSDRLDYMLSEIDEHLPSSEDLFEGEPESATATANRHTGQDPGANRKQMREGSTQSKENRARMELGTVANRPTYLGEVAGLALEAIREDDRLSGDDGLALLAEMRDWAEVEDTEDLEELDLSWWTDQLDVELDERADWLVDYLDTDGEA